MDGQNRAIFLQKRRAARAKPLQKLCTIARRASRKFWQRQKSFAARSLRFWRAFGAGGAFLDGQNRAIFLQKRRAARAKPLQNTCKIARRAPRKFWQRRRSLAARSLRFWRAFGAGGAFFDGQNRAIFTAKTTRGARQTIAKRVRDRSACAAQVLAASEKFCSAFVAILPRVRRRRRVF